MIKRILAGAAVFLIAAAFFALIFLTATNAPANQIMALLFGLLVFPVIFYAFLLTAKLRKKQTEEDRKENSPERK